MEIRCIAESAEIRFFMEMRYVLAERSEIDTQIHSVHSMDFYTHAGQGAKKTEASSEHVLSPAICAPRHS